jgi:multiple sugar transport system ATP-binding protein
LILDELGERDGEAVPANRTVIAGIRPEHMEVGPDGTHPLEDNALRGTVVLQELIGADRLIYVDIQERQPLVVRTAPRNKYSHGDNVRVHVDFDSLHFFDPQSGERVY